MVMQVRTGKDALLQMELLMTEITQKINAEKEELKRKLSLELEQLRNKYDCYFCLLLFCMSQEMGIAIQCWRDKTQSDSPTQIRMCCV